MAKENITLISYRLTRLDNFGSKYRNTGDRFLLNCTIAVIAENGTETRKEGKVVLAQKDAERFNELKSDKGRLNFILKRVFKD